MEPFLGQIMQVGFNFAPRGWSTCQKQLLPVSQNTALFSLIGTTFGGDGRTTFGLPDAQGRVFVGAGAGAGLPAYNPGEAAGTPTTTLLLNQMPAHTHSAAFTPAGGGSVTGQLQAMTNSPEAQLTSTPGNGSMLANTSDPQAGGSPLIYAPAGATGTPVNLGGLTISGGGGGGTVTVGINGGSQPVGIMQPYLAVTTIIALQGIFPSRP